MFIVEIMLMSIPSRYRDLLYLCCRDRSAPPAIAKLLHTTTAAIIKQFNGTNLLNLSNRALKAPILNNLQNIKIYIRWFNTQANIKINNEK